MSRIRSVHPGFFKDERLVPCSAFARLLFIGLGVEADDKGIFEWKPLTLKMSIFPGDNVDVAALLAELVTADAVMQFKSGDRQYGAIRNFRKFQKPKTPNDLYPMPDFIAEYVAFPQKGETFPQKGEKIALMEDGGGKMEEEDGEDNPIAQHPEPASALRCAAPNWDGLLDLLLDANGVRGFRAERSPGLVVVGPIIALLGGGLDLWADVLPAIRAKPNPAASTWKYFEGQIREFAQQRRSAVAITESGSPRASPRLRPPQLADRAAELAREFGAADVRSDQNRRSLPAPFPNLS